MTRSVAKALCTTVALSFLGVGLAAAAADTGNGGKDGKGGAAPANPAAAPVVQPGKVTEIPIDTRMFKTPKEYYAKPIQQKIYRAYKAKQYPKDWEPNRPRTPDECAGYKDAQTAVIYVPPTYDGTEAYGVYVHINPTEGGLRPSKEWQAVLDKMHLIFVSPNKTSNNEAALLRVVLGLDALATVEAKFKVNPARVFVGGFSGGGHMAMLSQMMYPEIYQGAISHAAQSLLPAHFPGLTVADAKAAPRAKRKWCVISGDKDKNYARVKETSRDWERMRFLYKFIDVPGMSHENAPAPAFEEALQWIGAGLPAAAGGAKQPAAGAK